MSLYFSRGQSHSQDSNPSLFYTSKPKISTTKAKLPMGRAYDRPPQLPTEKLEPGCLEYQSEGLTIQEPWRSPSSTEVIDALGGFYDLLGDCCLNTKVGHYPGPVGSILFQEPVGEGTDFCAFWPQALAPMFSWKSIRRLRHCLLNKPQKSTSLWKNSSCLEASLAPKDPVESGCCVKPTSGAETSRPLIRMVTFGKASETASVLYTKKGIEISCCPF